MKQQFIVTHKIRQTESRITRQLENQHTFCQNVLSAKKFLSSYFREKMTYVNFGLVSMSSFFFCLLYSCVFVSYDKQMIYDNFTLQAYVLIVGRLISKSNSVGAL